MTLVRPVLAACAALACVAAGAQSLSGVKVEPAVAPVGAPVTITGLFDSAGNPNCNLRVEYGDGQKRNFKINQEKDVPLITTHVYDKPGTYTVSVLPRTDLPTIKCMGGDRTTTVKIEPVAATVPVATAKPGAAGPSCPEGWKLDAKSVNKKNGAFTCTAKAGTAAPAGKLACPVPLGYFENMSRGQLGCRP